MDLDFKVENLKNEIYMNQTKCYKKKIHYIMMLDSSGSMNGNRWTDLMSAYKKFVLHLAEN
jgi:hypothetical protein